MTTVMAFVGLASQLSILLTLFDNPSMKVLVHPVNHHKKFGPNLN